MKKKDTVIWKVWEVSPGIDMNMQIRESMMSSLNNSLSILFSTLATVALVEGARNIRLTASIHSSVLTNT